VAAPASSVATVWQQSWRQMSPRRQENPTICEGGTPQNASTRALRSSGPCLGNQVDVRVLSSALAFVCGLGEPQCERDPNERWHCSVPFQGKRGSSPLQPERPLASCVVCNGAECGRSTPTRYPRGHECAAFQRALGLMARPRRRRLVQPRIRAFARLLAASSRTAWAAGTCWERCTGLQARSVTTL